MWVRTGIGMYFMAAFVLYLSGNDQSTFSEKPSLSRFQHNKKVEKRNIRKLQPPKCNQNELSNIHNNNRINPPKVGVRRQ